jgi:hypothetical protein
LYEERLIRKKRVFNGSQKERRMEAKRGNMPRKYLLIDRCEKMFYTGRDKGF